MKAALDQHGFEYEYHGTSITVLGKSVHAMNAPQGVNAVLRLCIALDDVFDFAPLDLIGKCFLEDATGQNLLGKVADESGQLTFNISSFEVSPKETRLQIDLRIPVTIDREQLVAQLSKRVQKYGLTYKFRGVLPLPGRCTTAWPSVGCCRGSRTTCTRLTNNGHSTRWPRRWRFTPSP